MSQDQDPEAPFDLEEEEEAARLSRALDGRAERAAPTDALEAALLLRVFHDSELSREREEAVLRQVLSEVRTPVARRRGWSWPLVWATLGVSVLVAVMLVDQTSLLDQGSGPILALPEPSLELIEAQASRLEGRAT